MDSSWDKIIEGKIEELTTRCHKKRGWVVLRKTWLTSSINYRMELSEIAVFSKLIVMADEFGPIPGLISDNDLRPMPHEYLAHQACCPLEIFEATLKKGIGDDSLYENSHGIFLTHFDDYQFTEYDRQKPSREKMRMEKQQALDANKKVYGSFENVLLRDDEYQKLRETFGADGAKARIQKLSEGIASKGYRYKSHYATILTWERMDQNKKDGEPIVKSQGVKIER